MEAVKGMTTDLPLKSSADMLVYQLLLKSAPWILTVAHVMDISLHGDSIRLSVVVSRLSTADAMGTTIALNRKTLVITNVDRKVNLELSVLCKDCSITTFWMNYEICFRTHV